MLPTRHPPDAPPPTHTGDLRIPGLWSNDSAKAETKGRGWNQTPGQPSINVRATSLLSFICPFCPTALFNHYH